MDDIVITGLGAVSCFGRGVGTLWTAMAAAISEPVPVTDEHARMTHRKLYAVPAEAIDAEPAEVGELPIGAAGRLAIDAAAQALDDAGAAETDPDRRAVVVGSGFGDWRLHEQWRTEGFPDTDAWAPTFSVAAAVGAGLIARGPNISVSNACAAGGYALSLAADLIRSGQADVVVAGGVETYHRTSMGCFNRLAAVDPVRCRPFDEDRQGTIFGEGAAMLVVESAARAARRPTARMYARLAGCAWSSDGFHLNAPEPGGTRIERAMSAALAAAEIPAAALGCVIPHATGTTLNDAIEARALERVLGAHARTTPAYSLKGLTGHTGGAAGAFAAVAAALMLEHGAIPPNPPIGHQDPQCRVWLPRQEERLRHPSVLVNAYGFGGNNVSLVLADA
ncbi:beta-ketoacyl-[acyl-carrier-protein] synthase family protein [Nocardia nova]|jgi:3-oxoacyl-(acyl-carrier-protein) synthase|uniref:beta-ketoacyl-[acyl-carrier-protein] synthase family protein n=3 Tax=Nocardia nova TaxID=37330 RepID=UPI0018935B53|nr:beta-ketoacyl synthase N-terminal-like domain-containing protein [Nocardia nova]MBF6150025.1 beta-ketoacyl-[acyl-carrier-protein] synthase family protein [Nocardia nova]